MSRKRAMDLLRVAISALLLWLLFRTVSWPEVAGELRSADPVPLIGAVLLYCVAGTVVRGYRWRALITSLGQPIGIGRSTKLFLVGTFFSQVLPTGIGGDVVRGLLLARDGLGRARALGTVFVDRAVGIVSLFGVGFLALALAPGRTATAVTIGLLVAGAAGGVALVVLFRAHRWRHRTGGIPVIGWLSTRPGIARFVDSFGEYDARALTAATAWAVAFTLLLIGANALLGRSVAITQADLLDWAVIVPLAALSQLLPSVGGWGVREWTYVGLLGLLDPPVGAATATAVSLLFGSMNLILATVGAILTAGGTAVGVPALGEAVGAERHDG